MRQELLLNIVFLSQAMVISGFFTVVLYGRIQHILASYPPAEFPKLYPVSADVIQRALTRYVVVNVTLMLIGVGIVAHKVLTQQEQLLGWDNQAVIAMYYMLQMTPWILILRDPGFTLINQLLRSRGAKIPRTASLKRRRLFDFVSPVWVGAAVLSYALFVGHVLRFPEDWGKGYWNILFATLLALFWASMIRFVMTEKKKDPYQSTEDRLRGIRIGVGMLIFGCIAGNLFLVINTVAEQVAPGLDDIIQSLYFQILQLVTLFALRIGQGNFDVYRAEPRVDESAPFPNGAGH